MFRILVYILFILALCVPALAQHPFYYTIHDDNGLPSNEVYQLQQDDFGYLWIGCNAGLFRYDGFTFKPYKNQRQNSVAISGLSMQPTEKLYCQNFSGQIFCADKDSLHLLADVKDRVRLHPSYTTDDKGTLWIALPEGILKKDRAGHEQLLLKSELKIIEIETAHDGSLIALDMNKGLIKLTANKAGTYSWSAIPGCHEAFANSTTNIEKNGNRLFTLSATNDEHNYYITEIVNDTARLIKAIPKHTLAEFIYSVALIDNKLWLGTSSGAYCMDMQGNVESNYFNTEKISDIIRDREGSYWFSSLQNGLFVVPNRDLITLTTANSTLKDNNITALKTVSANNIFFGTYSGDVYSYSISSRQLVQLPKSKTGIYRNVTSIIPCGSNTIVVGRGAVSIIDLAAKKDYSRQSLYMRNMVRKGDSILFVSSETIGSIGPVPQMVKDHTYQYHDIKRVSGKQICFDETAQAFWVTLNDGLAIFSNNGFTPFKVGPDPMFCNVLYSDHNGLWAGTVSDGVYNIRDRKPVLHLTTANGLHGTNVRAILSANDTLYVATDACINIRYPNGALAYLDYTDGINAKEINALEIAGRSLFIGTIRGIFLLPVSAIFTNNLKPRITITSVYANGIRLAPGRPVELAWNSKDVLVNFSSAALRSRGHFHYLYRIKGFRNEWQKLDGSINYVRLNHLPAGNFIFEVMAVNEDGISSATPAVLSIVSIGPFWQHWCFYLLLIIVVAAAVAILFILRIRKIRHNAHIRNQVTSSQLTALKAQMNPHFMYNTLNSIQDLILQNDIKSTNYYLSRYSTLMRKILESSESSEIELNEEIEILELYMELEKLRFGSDFIYTINVADSIERNSIQLPSMIIQPFVENAIKHGLLHKKGIKQLNIQFERTGHLLVCSIQDNGIGRKKAAEIKQRSPIAHRSFATKATERRLELVNLNRKNKIKLIITDLEQNNTPSGTGVRLEIPL